MSQLIRYLRVVTCGAALLLTPYVYAAAAPDWQLNNLQGEAVGLADYRGQIVLVDFWASWCVPCRGSMAALQQLQQEFAGRKVSIVPISVDEDLADAQAFQVRYGPMLGSAHDPSGRVADAYGLLGMPSSFIVDAQGQLAYRHEGYKKGDEDVWRQEIYRLLAAQP